MDCRETKRKLIKLADGLLAGDEENALREHLKECPGCARLASSEYLLVHDIEQVRAIQMPSPMTIGQIREEIIARERNSKKTNLGARIMRQVIYTYYKRPRFSLAAAAVSILILASILIPLRTERPGGYEVAFAAPASGLTLNRENVEKLLEAMGISDADIEVGSTESGTEFRIRPLRDSAKVSQLIAVLDSLGGWQVRSTTTSGNSNNRTIWQLLLNSDKSETGASREKIQEGKSERSTTINLDKQFKGDITLWMPIGEQSDDSLQGLLLDRKNGKTSIQVVGKSEKMTPDKCGWHQYLNNSVLHVTTPDGKQDTFRFYQLKDVRRLEKMGYNFATMSFETPRRIPIPGMGPRLIEIKPNPFFEKTTIEYMIPQAYEVKLQILDKSGREIRNLLDCTPAPCMPVGGIHNVTWDGLDTYGESVEPGTYLCHFTAGDYQETQAIRLER
jgi:hypothetical protein